MKYCNHIGKRKNCCSLITSSLAEHSNRHFRVSCVEAIAFNYESSLISIYFNIHVNVCKKQIVWVSKG